MRLIQSQFGLAIVTTLICGSTSFVPHCHFALKPVGSKVSTSFSDNSLSRLEMSKRSSKYDEDEDDESDSDFEYARVSRRRGRFMNDEDEYAKSSDTRRRNEFEFEEDYFDEYDDEYDNEYDDEYDDESDEDDEFEDIIPNPLLDQMDPDGSIERWPELFSDPQFWKDSLIWFFIAFLWLLGRFNNPMLNGIVDLDKIDYSQFYAK